MGYIFWQTKISYTHNKSQIGNKTFFNPSCPGGGGADVLTFFLGNFSFTKLTMTIIIPVYYKIWPLELSYF